MMKPYHYAWLATHPHRSHEWLALKLIEGFDIHHVDGNHENNDPANLMLIEHSDHMAIHNGGKIFIGRLKFKGIRGPRGPRKHRRPSAQEALALGKARMATGIWKPK